MSKKSYDIQIFCNICGNDLGSFKSENEYSITIGIEKYRIHCKKCGNDSVVIFIEKSK